MKQLILAIMLLWMGCKTLEEKCVERFPQEQISIVRETIRTDTIIRPSHTIEYLDTTLCPPNQDTFYVVKKVTKKMPPDTMYHDVMCIDTILVHRDQERVNWVLAELEATRALMAQERQSSAKKNMALIGLTIALLSFFFVILSMLFKR